MAVDMIIDIDRQAAALGEQRRRYGIDRGHDLRRLGDLGFLPPVGFALDIGVQRFKTAHERFVRVRGGREARVIPLLRLPAAVPLADASHSGKPVRGA